MAPSSRTRATQQPRSQVPVFRVTKSSRLNERSTSQLKQKTDALEHVISENVPLPIIAIVPSLELAGNDTIKISKKRRRASDVQTSEADQNIHESATKRIKKNAVSLKLKQQQHGTDTGEQLSELPELLQELSQLHKHFMHALSVHYAHNKGGIRDVIDLAALLPTMTRLWRKRSVQVQDIQCILALWEIEELRRPDTSGYMAEVQRVKGPFRIEQVGIGLNGATTLEYTWTGSGDTFVETELQRQYEDLIQRLLTTYNKNQRDDSNDTVSVFIWQNLDDVPKLQCEMSKSTQQRKEKVASIKSQILSKTKQPDTHQQPDLSNLSLHGPDSPPQKVQDNPVKSRTMNLFDRVRAKQLLNSTAASFTPAQLLRQRALQRIPDLVDVLRLKQARKVTGQMYEMQSLAGSAQMKVSFSFEALVQEIRDSLRAEVAGDEIREGITILGREMPDGWCRVYEMGSVKCVTLQGEAMSRRAIETWSKSLINQAA